jgi:hypothetical protein
MPVNTNKVAKIMSGLPTKEQMLTGNDRDNLTGAITNPETGEEQPATLREGEYVLDIPSIIGLGEGDYKTGLEKIQKIHQSLRDKGLSLMESLGLGGVE